VLVMRDEDKPLARKYFSTPLLFSIHEAKGLEYENIVLFRFVSDHRAEFSEIVEGVRKADLAGEALDYRRAKDKSDKSLEVFKFYVNALYVAITRAIRNLYLIESDTAHPLFALLDLTQAGAVKVEARQATLEDWQKEARKLELQGKQEQAEAIRSGILKQTPVPWPVFDQARTEGLLVKVFRERAPGGKVRQQLYDVATCHDLPALANMLEGSSAGTMQRFLAQRVSQGRKTFVTYFSRNLKEILRQCDSHGLEHRLPMNLTPLMAAAAAGNVPLVEALIERGSDREASDHFGSNALHWALREAFIDAKFANGPFARLYDLLAPAAVDVNTGERLVRIDRHMSEYFLFQTMWALFKTCFTHRQRHVHASFEAQMIFDVWQTLPTSVLRPERKKRAYVSSVLARNEVSRDYAYNRSLFQRVATGWYQFNPKLSVRKKQNGEETWVPVFDALNLPFLTEFTVPVIWPRVVEYLERAGLPERAVPIGYEQEYAQFIKTPEEPGRPALPLPREILLHAPSGASAMWELSQSRRRR
jgi:hypothetical protein